MHAGGRAEGVAPEDGVVVGQAHAAGRRHGLAVGAQVGQVAVVEPQELQVHEQQVHLHVAHALADAQRRAVDAVGPRLDRRQGVGQTQPPIAVAVPIDLHVLPGGLDDRLAHEAHERTHAGGRGVPDRVRQADPTRAPADRVPVERLQHVRTRPRRILGDEHHRQPLADGSYMRGNPHLEMHTRGG